MSSRSNLVLDGTRLIVRVGAIGVAAAAVAALAFLALGAPTPARQYPQNEIARFSPTAGHALGQFLGETFLLFLVAYIGRRWLDVHL